MIHYHSISITMQFRNDLASKKTCLKKEVVLIKVGVIFFGLPRATAVTLPSIQQYVFDELKEYSVFVESCLTIQDSVNNPRSNELCALDKSNYDFFKTKPHQLLLPNELLDANLHRQLLQLGDAWQDNGQSLKNLLMQLHSIKLAYLKAKQNECNVYLFIRPDLLIHDYIPIKEFIQQYAHKKAAMVPSWQWFGGLNDRFSVVSAQAADAYGLRYDQILNYCLANKQPLHGESFIADCLKNNQTIIKTCRTKMSRIRASGEIKSEQFSNIMGKRGFKNVLFAIFSQVRLQDKMLTLFELFKFTLYSVAVKLKIAQRRY